MSKHRKPVKTIVDIDKKLARRIVDARSCLMAAIREAQAAGLIVKCSVDTSLGEGIEPSVYRQIDVG